MVIWSSFQFSSKNTWLSLEYLFGNSFLGPVKLLLGELVAFLPPHNPALSVLQVESPMLATLGHVSSPFMSAILLQSLPLFDCTVCCPDQAFHILQTCQEGTLSSLLLKLPQVAPATWIIFLSKYFPCSLMCFAKCVTPRLKIPKPGVIPPLRLVESTLVSYRPAQGPGV